MRSARIEYEPPCIPEDGRAANVDSDDHVTEEEPLANKWLTAVPWWNTHNGVVRGVETERSGGQAVSNKVDPEKLDWN